jgi:glycosyltransferase involved in cell wall biosynthesis
MKVNYNGLTVSPKIAVSICILNWNNCDILKKTIEVILNEIKDISAEIIIFDQASSDGSIEYLQSLQQNNIFVFFNNKNIGNSISRNKMIEKARGKYVMLLDGDILLVKGSIKFCVDFLDKNDEYCGI